MRNTNPLDCLLRNHSIMWEPSSNHVVCLSDCWSWVESISLVLTMKWVMWNVSFPNNIWLQWIDEQEMVSAFGGQKVKCQGHFFLIINYFIGYIYQKISSFHVRTSGSLRVAHFEKMHCFYSSGAAVDECRPVTTGQEVEGRTYGH